MTAGDGLAGNSPLRPNRRGSGIWGGLPPLPLLHSVGGGGSLDEIVIFGLIGLIVVVLAYLGWRGGRGSRRRDRRRRRRTSRR